MMPVEKTMLADEGVMAQAARGGTTQLLHIACKAVLGDLLLCRLCSTPRDAKPHPPERKANSPSFNRGASMLELVASEDPRRRPATLWSQPHSRKPAGGEHAWDRARREHAWREQARGDPFRASQASHPGDVPKPRPRDPISQ